MEWNGNIYLTKSGNSPKKVMVHMPKVFQAVNTFELTQPADPEERPSAVGRLQNVIIAIVIVIAVHVALMS